MSYFGIGVIGAKYEANVGSLWRSAHLLGADLIFTIGQRYKQQATDTSKATTWIPLLQFDSLADFLRAVGPNDRLIGIELGGTPLRDLRHPKQGYYLLGAEDAGLSPDAMAACSASGGLVSIEAVRPFSYNVAIAGSIVMYDRLIKGLAKE